MTATEITRRRWTKAALALVATILVAVPLSECSAPPPKAKVVILTPLPFAILDESIAGIRKGLADAGYGPDRLELKEVSAGGQMQMLSSYAREIVADKPAVIVPVSTPATEAVVGAAPATQNVVFSTVTDPAKARVPASSGNITGVSDVVNFEANIALLQELFPKARRIGTIYNPGDDAAVFGLDHIRPILKTRGLLLVVAPASNSNEAVSAARALAGKVDVIYIGSDSNAASAMAGIVAVANRARTPVIASDAGSVRNGALAAVSVDYEKLGEAGAALIVQILKTGKPAGQFPRVAFVGNTLVLNAGTARTIGYAFPPTVLARKPDVVGTP